MPRVRGPAQDSRTSSILSSSHPDLKEDTRHQADLNRQLLEGQMPPEQSGAELSSPTLPKWSWGLSPPSPRPRCSPHCPPKATCHFGLWHTIFRRPYLSS